MLSISIETNDSPKLYFAFYDIYDNELNIATSDLIELKYSITRLVAGRQYPVEGFTDIDIPSTNWHSEPASYPSNIKGLSPSQDEGYNLEVYPYRNENGEWVSPFSEPNSTYYLTVTLAYYMSDVALDDVAMYRRSISVAVKTGSV